MSAHTSTDVLNKVLKILTPLLDDFSTNLELLGGDIVSIADEDTLVLVQQFRGLLKVGSLPCLSIPFDHFEYGKGLVT